MPCPASPWLGTKGFSAGVIHAWLALTGKGWTKKDRRPCHSALACHLQETERGKGTGKRGTWCNCWKRVRDQKGSPETAPPILRRGNTLAGWLSWSWNQLFMIRLGRESLHQNSVSLIRCDSYCQMCWMYRNRKERNCDGNWKHKQTYCSESLMLEASAKKNAIMGYITWPPHCDIQYQSYLFCHFKEVRHNRNAGKIAYSWQIMTYKVIVKRCLVWMHQMCHSSVFSCNISISMVVKAYATIQTFGIVTIFLF